MFLLNRLHAPCWLSTQISLFVNKARRRGGTEFRRRGCVNSRLMTRLAGYYAQLSLMMIGIDAISHGFLRTSFRNGGPPPAASLENTWAAWTTNPISTPHLLTPSKAGVGQINDILTDIFSTSAAVWWAQTARTRIWPQMFSTKNSQIWRGLFPKIEPMWIRCVSEGEH